MLAQHRHAFFKVAIKHNCWIGLRDPNPLSDPWIGEPKCYPKPITCKAKTCDLPGKPFSGLVVCPWRRADHFTDDRREKARAIWEDFEALLWETEDPNPASRNVGRYASLTTATPLPGHRFVKKELLCGSDSTKYDYHLIVDGPRDGVVLYRGAMIFADYDIYAIVGADDQGRMSRHWSETQDAEKYWEVVRDLHGAFLFSIDMVQHGADFDWLSGTATASGDHVLWFGPGSQETFLPATDGQFSVTRIQSVPTGRGSRKRDVGMH